MSRNIFSELMVIYIIWKDNIMAFTAKGINLNEFKATGLNENQEVAIWKLGTISVVFLEDRKTMKTFLETTGYRTFLIRVDL
jgi:hypothetical protein